MLGHCCYGTTFPCKCPPHPLGLQHPASGCRTIWMVSLPQLISNILCHCDPLCRYPPSSTRELAPWGGPLQLFPTPWCRDSYLSHPIPPLPSLPPDGGLGQGYWGTMGRRDCIAHLSQSPFLWLFLKRQKQLNSKQLHRLRTTRDWILATNWQVITYAPFGHWGAYFS